MKLASGTRASGVPHLMVGAIMPDGFAGHRLS
jgi:hypothetical protein